MFHMCMDVVVGALTSGSWSSRLREARGLYTGLTARRLLRRTSSSIASSSATCSSMTVANGSGEYKLSDKEEGKVGEW